jgi:hypothetical protein
MTAGKEGTGVRVRQVRMLSRPAPKPAAPLVQKFLQVGATYKTRTGRLVMLTTFQGAEVLLRYLDVPEREFLQLTQAAAARVLTRQEGA